ncbi:MAG: carbohydrate-binding protein [Verrucomicrobiota bacterium JB025]|nr:carbohydrate-binding protein [Verrucomicrobiota bacterium JB025]
MKLRLIACAWACASLSAHADIVVNDSFDDGAIGSNGSGLGSGFNSRVDGTAASVTETNGFAILDSPANGGRRAQISSKESADTTTTFGAVFLFEDVGFAISSDDSGDGTTHRTYLGLRGSNGLSNNSIGEPGQGFFVEFGFGDLSGNAAGTSTFFYNDASNNQTTLATWTFDTLSILDSGVVNAELDVEITVSGTEWSIEVLGDTHSGGAAISFSGTHADSSIAPDIATGFAYAANQSESPNLELSLGRVEITTLVRQFVHPGFGVSLADLDHVKARLDIEPWKTGYNDMLDSDRAGLEYVMRGPFAEVGRRINNGEWEADMEAVHCLARQWYYTENEAYARKARDILISWATTHTSFASDQAYLSMGYEGMHVFEGAEILRGTWPGWTQSDTDTLKTYFENVWWNSPELAMPGPQRSANQGMSQYLASLGVAIFNDDEEKFEQCLHTFLTDATALLPSSLPNGQIGDSGRDSHDQGQLMLMVIAAESFWKQGVDVYSAMDHRMLAAGEYLSRFNLRVDTPFIQAGTVYDIYPGMHSLAGEFATTRMETKMLTLLHSAYVIRSGMRSPYLEAYFGFATQNKDSFHYLKESDPSTAAAPASVTPAADVASATSLQSTNMGDASGGSASYNSGTDTWTVSGKGTSLWYSSEPDYRFAYLPVTGDATIIAQLTSFSGGGDLYARAGLVFTESLNNGDTMGAVVLTAPDDEDDLDCFYRGFEASSHNDDSHGKPNQSRPRLPYWLKIERIGDRVTFYSSPDGASWSCAGCADYDLADTAYFGLAVSADNNSNTATATFKNVRITGGDGREPSQVPAAPIAIYASPGGDQIPLRWLESFEADSYRIWRTTTPGGPYTLVTEQTGTSYIDTGILYGAHYYYAVSAVNSQGESPLSPESSFAYPETGFHEAEDYDAQQGIGTEDCGDFWAGLNLSSIAHNEWARYDDITIESGVVFQARCAVNGSETRDPLGTIEIRLGSTTGTLVGVINPIDTAGWQYWATAETTLSGEAVGTHDIYLVFKGQDGGSPGINLNWFDIVYPAITEYDLGRDLTITHDPDIHALTNLGSITAWTSTSSHLKLADGSNLANFDFTSLGITSWETTDFDNPAVATNWNGANLSGITLITDGNFGAGDDFKAADFSNVVWGAATSTADATRFFSGGSGATSAAAKDDAISFHGADFSLITGQARTAMIDNLGGFDGDSPIGAKFDPAFLALSGWDKEELTAAGWQYSAIDAFATIEAETHDNQSGVSTQTTTDTGGGLNAQAINHNDWCAYQNVDFGNGAASFLARVASNTSGGNIEIRLGSPTGTLVGTCTVPGTNGWQTWETVSTELSGVSGAHDLYLVFTGGSGYLFNLNWFTFTRSAHTLTYNAGLNGSISGTSPQMIDPGSNGSPVTAVADSTHHFSGWSDGITDNPRTDTNVTGDLDVTAVFTTNSAIENWRVLHFGTHENSGAAADGFDADLDGLSNLLEYATGSDPAVPGPSPLTIGPATAGTGRHLAFNRIADPSLHYLIEGRADLESGDWIPVWSGTGTSATTVTIPDTTWPDGHDRYFFRLVVGD